MEPDQILVVGRIGSAYGVKGWSHVHSFTDPITNILEFPQMYSRREDEPWQPLPRIEFRRHQSALIARLDECDDRTRAEALRNLELGVHRDAMPELPDDEFYWVDLIGLDVLNTEAITLGKISKVIETGASAVLAVKGKNAEYLIPFVKPILDSVSLDSHVTVRWDASWEAEE